MPKVLHLRTVTGHGGGPEKTLLLSPKFIGDDYSLELAYIRPADDAVYDLPRRAAQLGATLIDIPERGPMDPRTMLRLSRLIRRTRPDILHAHDYKTNILAALLSRWHRVPALTTVHGYVSQSRKLNLYYRIDRWALKRMDHIVVVSDDLYQLVRQWGIAAVRCSLVENAIDIGQFSRELSATEAKQKLGIDPSRLVVGAVGRLEEEKGFDRLISAVHYHLRRGVNLELIIIGEGQARQNLESQIANLGCGDRVRLLGYRSDIIDLYQAMDVFALSSLREAFPNVVLEALAMEVPVVATKIAGVPQIIEHDENGLLIAPDNIDQLSAALGGLLEDAPLRQRLADSGRRTIEQRFTFQRRMEKIRAIYDRMLGRTVHPRPLEPAIA